MRVLQVDIVVPVRNEERDLAPSIRRLVGFLRESFPFTARVTIADNGSTDATWAIADRLARELPEVRAVHIELPGRGRALRAIWSQSEAEVLAYMDVDLSTDLNALLPLRTSMSDVTRTLITGAWRARAASLDAPVFLRDSCDRRSLPPPWSGSEDKAWMSQPCRSSCMNGTSTSYDLVRPVPE